MCCEVPEEGGLRCDLQLARQRLGRKVARLDVGHESSRIEVHSVAADRHDSSPDMIADHCATDIAAVPLSDNRSMVASAACTRNRLWCASASPRSRQARSVILIGSTTLMRKGSMMVFIVPFPGLPSHVSYYGTGIDLRFVLRFDSSRIERRSSRNTGQKRTVHLPRVSWLPPGGN